MIEYFIMTQNKYEFYLTSAPASDVILSIKWFNLSKDIEYYTSSSNSRRIILEETFKKGDLIEAFYTAKVNNQWWYQN
jgi:hypothetical protein